MTRCFRASQSIGSEDSDRTFLRFDTATTTTSRPAQMPAVEGVLEGQNLRTDRTGAGHPVYQVLQDYQGNTVGRDGQTGWADGGGGWLRIMEFDVERRKNRFHTYSPC